MTRLAALGALALSLGAVASCTIEFDRVLLPGRANQDARIILQGMKSAPLRPGDKPVDITPE